MIPAFSLQRFAGKALPQLEIASILKKTPPGERMKQTGVQADCPIAFMDSAEGVLHKGGKTMDVHAELLNLKQVVDAALAGFHKEEMYLLEQDLSERCICARFALHLTEALRNTPYKGYFVDVEYNRGADGHERAVKRLDDTPITVDLIVHKRGRNCRYSFDNLICVEMKKTASHRSCASAEARLRAMTDGPHGFQYKLGVMLLIDTRAAEVRIKSLFQDGVQRTGLSGYR